MPGFVLNVYILILRFRKLLEEADFYKIGVSFVVGDVEETEKGTQSVIRIVDRVEIKSLRFENGAVFAEYENSPDQEDMGEKDQEEMLVYFKKVVHDISAQFQGGEQ